MFVLERTNVGWSIVFKRLTLGICSTDNLPIGSNPILFGDSGWS